MCVCDDRRVDTGIDPLPTDTGDQCSLAGATIAVTAERRADQQLAYLTKRGATTVHAPVLRTIDQTERPELAEITERFLDAPPDVLVVQTGQGLRWWFDALEPSLRDHLVASLQATEVWCRGIKATSACRGAGLTVSWQAPDESSAEILARLGTSAAEHRHIAIQLDGNDLAWRDHAVDSARLTLVDLYRYTLPDDLGPAAALIDGVIDGRIDAVTFTASPAIRHLREIADRHGRRAELDAAFRDQAIAAVVGPVCAATASDAGWTNLVEPDTARLMPMLSALAGHLTDGRRGPSQARPAGERTT